jgi:hypothetical protein
VVFSAFDIQKLLWPGNSLDFNVIEPTWFWMKRETTKKGPLYSAEALKKEWIKCWNEMPQEKIQAWIERIPRHIQEVIACKGANLYQEGRPKANLRLGYISTLKNNISSFW